MNDAREAFGPTLKTQRERHGITLSAVAESTKIGIGLLSALERNDLSRWPPGLFRRAFFREYVIAIGLSPEPLLSEFARLFPDEPGPSPAAEPTDFRLTLAESGSRGGALRRVAVVLGELAVLFAAGGGAAWLLEVDFRLTSGLAALVYYPLSNVFVERRLRMPDPPLPALLNPRLPMPDSPSRRREVIDTREELQASF